MPVEYRVLDMCCLGGGEWTEGGPLPGRGLGGGEMGYLCPYVPDWDTPYPLSRICYRDIVQGPVDRD